MSRPLALSGFTFFAALIAVGLYGYPAAAVLAAVPVFLALFSRIRPLVTLQACAVMLVAVCCAAGLYWVKTEYDFKAAPAYVGEGREIRGVIADVPEYADGRYYYTVNAESVGGAAADVKIRYSAPNPLEADPFDRVTVPGATVYILAEGTDYQRAYMAKGLYLGAYSFYEAQVTENAAKPAAAAVVYLRRYILDCVDAHLDMDSAAFVNGILLGDTDAIREETAQDFRYAGLAHIFSVSGLHLSFWGLLVFAILRKLKMKQRPAILATFPFLLAFMALFGFTESVMRAGVMLIVVLLGRLFREQSDGVNSLGLAVLLICLANPYAAGSVSLILSFSATLGLLLFTKPLLQWCKEFLAARRLPGLVRDIGYKASGAAAVSVAAVVGVMPASAAYFGYFSLIAPLSNLLVIWAVELDMISAGLGVAAAKIGFLSDILFFITDMLTNYIRVLASFFGSLPFSAVSLDTGAVLLFCGVCAAAYLAFYALGKASHAFNRTFALVSAAVFLFGCVAGDVFPGKSVKIFAAGVENASCVVVTCGGRAAIIGAGGYGCVFEISSVIREERIKSVDLLLVPRAADTESEYAAQLLERYSPKNFVCPPASDEDGYGGSLYETRNARVFSGDSYELVSYDGEEASVCLLKAYGVKILLCFYPATDLNALPEEFRGAQALICRSALPVNARAEDFQKVVILCGEERGGYYEKLYGSDGGVFNTWSDGTVKMKISVNGALKTEDGR